MILDFFTKTGADASGLGLGGWGLGVCAQGFELRVEGFGCGGWTVPTYLEADLTQISLKVFLNKTAFCEIGAFEVVL